MREVLKAIKDFKLRRRGHVPNLRGAIPVGRVKGGHSYVARTVSRRRSGQATSWNGEVLGAEG